MLLIAEIANSYTVGWGSLALINAGLAQSKKRGGLNWFLLSIFIGPLATLALVAFCERLPDEEGTYENAQLTTDRSS